MSLTSFLSVCGLASVGAYTLDYPVTACLLFYPIYLTGLVKFIGSLGLGNGGGAEGGLNGLFMDVLILITANGAYFYYVGSRFG